MVGNDPHAGTVAALDALRSRFAGQTAIVVATGPGADIQWRGRITDHPVVAVSDAWQLCERDPDILYACDAGWWRHWLPSLGHLSSLFVGLDVPEVVSVKTSGIDGYDERLGYVRDGANSGYQAVHLAAQLGARRIVLVGFEMKSNAHFFGQHPETVAQRMSIIVWRRCFAGLARELERRGVEVVNTMPDSGLRCFPFADLDDVL